MFLFHVYSCSAKNISSLIHANHTAVNHSRLRMHSLSSDNGAHSADLFRRMETCTSKSKSVCCLLRELRSPRHCLCGTWIIFGFPCGIIMHNHPLKPICSLKTHLSVKPVAFKPYKLHSYRFLHHMCAREQIQARICKKNITCTHDHHENKTKHALCISRLSLWKVALKESIIISINQTHSISGGWDDSLLPFIDPACQANSCGLICLPPLHTTQKSLLTPSIITLRSPMFVPPLISLTITSASEWSETKYLQCLPSVSCILPLSLSGRDPWPF